MSPRREHQHIIFITATWNRPGRVHYLRRVGNILTAVDGLTWLVVEDDSATHADVAAYLNDTGIRHRYWACGPTNDKGNAQRNAAFEYIVDQRLNGVVYNGDDDNQYYLPLFEELRSVRGIGILAVANLGPQGVERPIVVADKIVGWQAGWTERVFPVDMGGFAFNSDLLTGRSRPLWEHIGVGGESEFLIKIGAKVKDLELLGSGCAACYVWHNEPLIDDQSW